MARTAMIVDDVEFVRKTLHRILTDAHYEVVGEATDGEKAIEVYTQVRPDIVIMDLVMPGMSGIQTTRKLMKMDKHARVIILSALKHETLVMEAILAGARDYVVKPFEKEHILDAMSHILTKDQV